MNRIRKVIVTGLGTGYLPASGTWASAAVCLIYLALWRIFQSANWPTSRQSVVLSVVMAILAVISSAACVAYGRFCEQAFGGKDPHKCTIDEWAGQAVALILLPLSDPKRIWLAVLTAFLAFRAFDVIKPLPGRRVEKLPFGWGILLDDIVAGIYANIVSQLILRLGFHL
jgi:phosphatidylglycerophosphatase A